MKVGILTSGGDTPGMNTVIRAILIHGKLLGYEFFGFKGGWKGLMDGETLSLPDDPDDLLNLGGTILKSGRVNPYKDPEGINKIKSTIQNFELDSIIAIGGEDTLGVANKLTQEGIRIVGIPKTIDNDLDETDYTFGFNTAVTIATDALDKVKTTAKSHDRVIVVELMGRHAGWLTLYSGIAGGAHVILIPEYPLPFNTVVELIKKRYESGKEWGIIAVSEGYGFTEEHEEHFIKDEFGHIRMEKINIGQKIADELKNELNVPTRAITLGHIQRGGPPSAYDRVLCTRLGLAAINLLKDGEFGKMPALKGTKIIPVDLADAVANLKTVDEEHWNTALQIMGIK